MTNRFEASGAMAVSVARAVLRSPRRALDASTVRRLVAAGKLGAAHARVLRYHGEQPWARDAARGGRGKSDPLGVFRLRRDLSAVQSVVGKRSVRGAAVALGSNRAGGAVAGGQRVAARLEIVAAASAMSPTQDRIGSTIRRVRTISGGVNGRVRRATAAAASKLTRHGVTARNSGADVPRSGARPEMRLLGRQTGTGSLATVLQRSAAPVNRASGVTSVAEAMRPNRDNAGSRHEVADHRGFDVQRWFGDRLLRQASLPPASASGFDGRLGPDWHAVGSLS